MYGVDKRVGQNGSSGKLGWITFTGDIYILFGCSLPHTMDFCEGQQHCQLRLELFTLRSVTACYTSFHFVLYHSCNDSQQSLQDQDCSIIEPKLASLIKLNPTELKQLNPTQSKYKSNSRQPTQLNATQFVRAYNKLVHPESRSLQHVAPEQSTNP